MDIPRYSRLPLPPYRHRPGLTPHPTRDPAGHAHGRAPLPTAPFLREHWRRSQTYLFGIDLFNHRYWWECHEVLEVLWLATGRGGSAASVLQGLIQTAAGLLQQERGNHRGARRLARRALAHLAVGGDEALGLDMVRLRREIASALLAPGKDADPPPLLLLSPGPSAHT